MVTKGEKAMMQEKLSDAGIGEMERVQATHVLLERKDFLILLGFVAQMAEKKALDIDDKAVRLNMDEIFFNKDTLFPHKVKLVLMEKLFEQILADTLSKAKWPVSIEVAADYILTIKTKDGPMVLKTHDAETSVLTPKEQPIGVLDELFG